MPKSIWGIPETASTRAGKGVAVNLVELWLHNHWRLGLYYGSLLGPAMKFGKARRSISEVMSWPFVLDKAEVRVDLFRAERLQILEHRGETGPLYRRG